VRGARPSGLWAAPASGRGYKGPAPTPAWTGCAAASDGALTVVLDTTLTPALVSEGLARELIAVLQQARKAAGLEVTDRIRVTYATADAELAQALARHAGLIAEEVPASSFIKLADEAPAHSAKAPGAFGGSPISLLLYVPHVDAMITKAAAAGATIKAQPEDRFYGDRMGTLVDPFGHTWHISTHIEDVTVEEIERRMAAM